MSYLPTKPIAEPWSEVIRLTEAVRELEAELARQEPVMEAASALFRSLDWDLDSPKEALDVYGAYLAYLDAKKQS